MIKKSAIAIMVVLTFITNSVFVHALDASPVSGLGVNENTYDKAKFVLSAVDVMTENEYGSFRPSENVTRAEFTEIIARINNAEDAEYSCDFYDVPSFYSYVGYAAGAGYMNGYTDGTFRPDNLITYREAAAVMVKMVGYDAVARANGGYPEGYFEQAVKLGIMDDLNIMLDDNVTRAGLAVMLYNTGRVKVFTETGSRSYTTLLDERMDRLKLRLAKGIITGTDGVAIDGRELRGNDILIDGYRYHSDMNAAANEYLGAEVEFFYNEEENTVISMRTLHHESLVVDAEDISSADLNNIRYYENEQQNKEKRAKLSGDARYIYNHRAMKPFDGSEALIDNGMLTLVDTDRDGNYDLVIIDEYDSFVVDGVNYEDNIIYLKDRYLNEKPYIKINEDKTGYETYLVDSSDAAIAPTDIKTDDSISVYQSLDGSYVKIIKINEYAEGVVSFINREDIRIGDETYKIAFSNNLPLVDSADITFGQSHKFYLDINGKIFAVKDDNAGGNQYGIITDIVDDMEQKETIYVKIARGRTYRESIDETVDEYDIRKHVLTFANTEYFKAELSDKVSVNGSGVKKEKISNYIRVGDAVDYKLKEDKIVTLTPLLANGEKGAMRKLDYRTKTFGGDVGGAFFFDKDTIFVIDPRNKSETRNFSIKLQHSHGDNLDITGYGVDEETKIAKMAVIATNKDFYEFSSVVTPNTRIGIIRKIIYELNDDGDPEYKLIMYSNGQEYIRSCINDPALINKAEKLEVGDVIYCFANDGGGYLADLSVIFRSKNAQLFESVTSGEGASQTEKVYGRLYGLKQHTLLDTSLKATDIITVSVNGDGSDALEYFVPEEYNKAAYYVYDTQKKAVSIFDDNINSVQNTDLETGDNVFVYKYGDNVKVVVFVKGGLRL